ncbi:MAG: choice-of-anchor D domain-containing protein, partial [Bryobacterales bacterium]|nr:choice-of-anchor D domain-containing protein [Bryobacterales bacterium]
GSTCSGTLAAGATCSIFVTFTPSAAGSRSASLQFTDSAPGSPQNIMLSGASSVSASFSATGLIWAQQLINIDPSLHTNLTPPQEEIVTNSGGAPLVISSVTISGSNSSDWYIWEDTCSGQRIAAAGYCAVFVSFDPIAAGSKTATLQIVDNAGNSPQTIALSGTASAGRQYFVASNGSDANDGTSILTPWLTLNHAAHYAYSPGSIVNVRGGYYLNQSWASYAGNNVTTAMPVVLRAYPGEVPVLTGPTLTGEIVLTGAPAIVDQLHFEDISGFAMDVLSTTAVFNCTFRRNQWEWIRLDSPAVGVTVKGNVFDTNGFIYTDGEEDAIVLDGAQNVLIQNNFFTRCGHYCASELVESGVTIQNIADIDNSIVQYWGGGLQATGQIPWPKTLVLGNRITHVGEAVHYTKDALFTLGSGLIARNNTITNTSWWFGDSTIGLLGEKVPANSDSPVEQNHIFHNTIYNDGPRTFYLFQDYSAGDGYSPNNTLNKLVNNVLFQAGDQVNIFGGSSVLWSAFTGDSRNTWTAFPNNNYLLNNLLNSSATANVVGWTPTSGYERDWTQTGVQSSYPLYFSGNITGNPLFGNAGNALNGNFVPTAGSPVIAAGTHLTTTTTAGSNTNTVTVADPYFFCDGYGITPGDMIVIAGNPAVRVLAVNYSGSTLTLGATVSYQSGAAVDLANYNGSAPDMGAFPYASSAPVISGISSSSVNGTTESISYSTNVAAYGEVEYGPTADYGRTALPLSSANPAISQTIMLGNLEPGKTYHYAVISTGTNYGRTVSADQTFTTASALGPTISNLQVSAIATNAGAVPTISWSTSTNSSSQVLYTGPGAVTTYVYQTAVLNPGPSGGVTSHSVTIDPSETITGTISSGSPLISGVSSTSGLIAGQTLSAMGIPSNTTILSWSGSCVSGTSGCTNPYTIMMSAKATANGTAESISASGLPFNTTFWYVVQSTDQSTGATTFSPQSMLITPSNQTAGATFSNISVMQTVGPEPYYNPPSGQTGYESFNSVGFYTCCGYSQGGHTTFAWSASSPVTMTGVNFLTASSGGSGGAQTGALYGQTFTGTLTNGSTTISNVSSTAGLVVGEWLHGPGQDVSDGGICAGTAITSLGTNSITMSQAASSNCGGMSAGESLYATLNNGVPSSGNPAMTSSPQITLYYAAPNTAMLFRLFGTDALGNTTTTPWMYYETPPEDLQEAPVIPPQVFDQEQTGMIASTTATIAATTYQAASCALEYGISTSYGNVTPSDSLATSHAYTLTGLTGSSSYHAALICTNSSGMSTTWQDFTFVTH